jgi:hypothetical protein
MPKNRNNFIMFVENIDLKKKSAKVYLKFLIIKIQHCGVESV